MVADEVSKKSALQYGKFLGLLTNLTSCKTYDGINWLLN